MTNEISQNRCKVLRDTPPRQVAKVNPRDWSLHRLGLKGQGKGYGECEGLAFDPTVTPASKLSVEWSTRSTTESSNLVPRLLRVQSSVLENCLGREI